MLMTIEEHGAGKQLVRLRSWPVYSAKYLVLTLLLVVLSINAAFNYGWIASAILSTIAMLLALRIQLECANATAAVLRVLERLKKGAM
jgi:NADH:ubiquinone oxidoreductase subunit 3 (subunit A)